MRLHGWGRFPSVDAELAEPVDARAARALLAGGGGPLTPRGAGRSYGDSALGERIISSRFLDNLLELDERAATLRCGAGVTLDAILGAVAPRGLFLPVLPGTRHVTVGGAVAADIHGKNHHRDGSFCDHVESVSLLLPDGETAELSRRRQAELFRATCGGMGLTGFILEATIRLIRIGSGMMRRETVAAAGLDECLDVLAERDGSRYSVAWVDCLAGGGRLGRSLVHLAEHSEDGGGLAHRDGGRLSVPFAAPGFLLSAPAGRAFNAACHRLGRRRRRPLVHYASWFFPLDGIGRWNRLYGRGGMIQYQLALPEQSARAGLREILRRVSGAGCLLAVMKRLGAGGGGPLSFPMKGVTLAMDFRRRRPLFGLLDELDRVVVAHGGRLNLAKDARMSEEVFKAGYPGWKDFKALKDRIDPRGRFASLQSRRVGLGGAAS